MTRSGSFPLCRAKAAEDEVSKHCHSLIPPSPRLWRGKPAVAGAMAGQARPSIHTLTRSPAFAWLRRAKSPTLSTPEEHLIRPSASFSPSNAEKGNLMGEGYEGESPERQVTPVFEFICVPPKGEAMASRAGCRQRE